MSRPRPIPTVSRKLEVPAWLWLILFITGLSAALQFYTEFKEFFQ